MPLKKGDRFGYWTVMRKTETRGSNARYMCRCVCGTERAVWAYMLRSGESQSCRCKMGEIRLANQLKQAAE